MSNACDPRNRPGFVAGDLTAFLPEPAQMLPQQPEELQTVLLAVLSAGLIVATVFGIVLFAA